VTPPLALRFLADESCDFAVLRALRADGYDVLAVSEITRRSVDRELIEQACRESCAVVTEDKDYWSTRASPEIVLRTQQLVTWLPCRDVGFFGGGKGHDTLLEDS
jgi:hypothetical protein